jgi:hypothetical protein
MSTPYFKKSQAVIWTLYVLLSYPLFYFAYKFGLPDYGGDDFFSYYFLYRDWDFSKVECPFNMRLISGFLIFLLNRLGLNYNTETAFMAIHPDYDQQVFFNAVLFNYLCVILTCIVIYKTIKLVSENELFAFLGGGVYLLGFGTLFFSLKPLSESCGILILSLGFYFYVQKSQWIYLIFPLALFQREYIFIVFGILAFYEFFLFRKKYFLWVFICTILFFAIYYILRKTIFYTPRWNFQTSPVSFLDALADTGLDPASFIRQSILISNLFWIYLGVLLYKKLKRIPFNRHYLIIILLLLAEVLIMSVLARFGNSAGRYFYYTSPILIFYLFKELKPVLSPYLNYERNV